MGEDLTRLVKSLPESSEELDVDDRDASCEGVDGVTCEGDA